ncbi:MAG: MAPEG family protein [Alphaproteobacteria bacterium]|nr:MAPEG family protein [Alphaproteobacteria bacterium]
MPQSMMTPVLALIVWTFVLWIWMYATRIPAIRKAGIDPASVKGKDALALLPARVNWVADNYNHLHEQPTVFYALAIYSHLVGVKDELNVALAWAYVALRVVHSLVQATSNYVPVRFYIFAAATLMLMVMTARNVWALIVTAAAV